MSELAFNLQGEPFEVPGTAASWRVRRIKSKGAPEVVYGSDGLPLILPIDADMDELRRELAGMSGRFRVDLLDDNSRPLAGVQAGYVFVHPEQPVPPPSLPTEPADISIEAMRLNTALARGVIERFSQMMESAAVLVRAGASRCSASSVEVPVLASTAEHDDDDGDDERPEPSAARPFDLNAIIGQVATTLVTSIANGTLQLPGLDALLDWRKASKPAPQVEDDRGVPATERPARLRRRSTGDNQGAASKSSAAVAATGTVGTFAQLAAIQAALSAEERTLAQAMASELTPAERSVWLDELARLSVPDAVVRVRAAMQRKDPS